MSIFSLFAILITVTALLAYLNERYTRLPTTIGVMLSSLVTTWVLTGMRAKVVPSTSTVRDFPSFG